MIRITKTKEPGRGGSHGRVVEKDFTAGKHRTELDVWTFQNTCGTTRKLHMEIRFGGMTSAANNQLRLLVVGEHR